jgi:hypothetical protein
MNRSLGKLLIVCLMCMAGIGIVGAQELKMSYYPGFPK